MQGLSASVVWTVGLALLCDTVKKDEIGQAMGYIAMAFSIGALAGPLLGGVVYSGAGYLAVFAMGFALIGLDIILRLLLIEKSVASQWDQPCCSVISPTGQTPDEIQPVPTTLPLSQESEKSCQTTPRKKMNLPSMIRLLMLPRLLASLFGCFVQATSLAAFDGTLPLFVKQTFHWNATGAGLIFICLVLSSMLSPIFGYISDRYGGRALTAIGFMAAIPFWVCLRFVTHNTLPQKVLLCALLSLIGLCLTMGMAPLMAEIDHVVELEEKRRPGSLGKRGGAAQGFGLFNSSFAIGTLIGPLWAGFVVQKSGWGAMGWSMAILSGVAALATFWWTGGRILLKEDERGSEAIV
jgi:MFS family permease